MNGGVYKIVCVATGKLYVGSAINFKIRKKVHWSQLKRGVHHSIFLQRAWKKHGYSQFQFVALEGVERPEDLVIREQHYIDILRPAFNTCRFAASSLGYRHTAEARLKMSVIRAGKPSPRLGAKHTVQSRKKMSKSKRGNAFFAGKFHSDVSRRKMAVAKTGARNVRAASVAQFTRDGDFVRQFDTLIGAFRATGIDVGNIRHVLSGRSKHAGGFVWKRLNKNVDK